MSSEEKYGSYASLVNSTGVRGVNTDTLLVFIGNCPSGDLNVPTTITTFAEASTELGITMTTDPSEYNLASAVFAAFIIAGISKITCIPVSHKVCGAEGIDTDYMGDSSLGTGIYALEAMIRDNPTATILVCIPEDVASSIDSALLALCKKMDIGYGAYMIESQAFQSGNINAGNYAVSSDIIGDKARADEYVSVVWGDILIAIDDDTDALINGAAVRACLMAKADAPYGCPARVGGNLALSSVKGLAINDGTNNVLVKMPRKTANEISNDGICTFRRRGQQWVSWGDHTSAFAGGSVDDERARFENRMRMQLMIMNRWLIKYEPLVDEPLTLTMRNDIINEQTNYLNGLVAIGGLIGNPRCEFLATSNNIDNIVEGKFVWDINTTETNPAKVIEANIAFTTEGLLAYTA